MALADYKSGLKIIYVHIHKYIYLCSFLQQNLLSLSRFCFSHKQSERKSNGLSIRWTYVQVNVFCRIFFFSFSCLFFFSSLKSIYPLSKIPCAKAMLSWLDLLPKRVFLFGFFSISLFFLYVSALWKSFHCGP